MKKCIVVILAAVFLVVLMPTCVGVAKAETVEEQLENQTKSQIEEIDMSELERIAKNADKTLVSETQNTSFRALVESIIDGKTTLSFVDLFNNSGKALAAGFKRYLPYVSVLVALVLLAAILNHFKPSFAGSSIGSVVFFSVFAVCVVVCSGLVFSLVVNVKKSVGSLNEQMQATFPVLLTLMTASGGAASVKIYQPAVAVLSGGVCAIFSQILLPLVSVMFVLIVVSNLSDDVKVDKFCGLCSSAFKWIIGLVGTIFMAYLGVQGMTAASADGVSIRTAKYAIKNYVPMLGGYISDGFEVVMASSMLLKNGIGVAALLLLLSSVLVPLFSIVVLSLSLKLVAAVTQPIADKKFTSFFAGVSKVLNSLAVVLIGVGLMYFLSVALMIGTANNIL